MSCFHGKATEAIELVTCNIIQFFFDVYPQVLRRALLSYSGSINNKFFVIVLT